MQKSTKLGKSLQSITKLRLEFSDVDHVYRFCLPRMTVVFPLIFIKTNLHKLFRHKNYSLPNAPSQTLAQILAKFHPALSHRPLTLRFNKPQLAISSQTSAKTSAAIFIPTKPVLISFSFGHIKPAPTSARILAPNALGNWQCLLAYTHLPECD